MKSSSKAISIPPPPEKPCTNGYMLFCKEEREKSSEILTLKEISAKFASLSEKEKNQVNARNLQALKEYTKEYSKWLENAKSKGFPDYPLYTKKAIKAVLKKETFKSEALPIIRIAAGAFTTAMKESLLRFMKSSKVKSLDMKVLMKFLEADPDKILSSVKSTKLYDKYMSNYVSGADAESDSEDEKKEKDKKSKKSSCGTSK
jgi:hypothetical protein